MTVKEKIELKRLRQVIERMFGMYKDDPECGEIMDLQQMLDILESLDI